MKASTEQHTVRYVWILIIGWTMMVSGIAVWNVIEGRQMTKEIAASQARAYFKKDVALRLWATRHGRIYVPTGDHYEPEPLLAHIPERDITTPSGLKLSLINPARIIRQLDEEFSDLYGVSGRITSEKPLRKENIPDAWERNALQSFQQGTQEVFEFTSIDGQPYLRLMQPLIMKSDCLLCHGKQGYKPGDIGGGVGILLPMQELLARERTEMVEESTTYLLLWLLGLAAIAIGYIRLRNQSRERLQAIDALESSERRKSAIMEAALDCIVSIDANGRIVEFNSAAENIFGYQREDVIGQDMAELLIPASNRDRHHKGLARQLRTRENQIIGTRIETEALRSDGSEFPVELTITRLDIDDEVIFTAFLRDITKARYMSEQLTWQATHDVLTGLNNRHVFDKRLDELIGIVDDEKRHYFLYMDLDQFKVVNDSSGHTAGDELLRQLAALLQEQLHSRHLLARLGGDEFGLLLEDSTLDESLEIANCILDAVSNFRFLWQDASFSVGISIGIVEIHGFGGNLTELLTAADAACYKAKGEGRNRLHVFQQDDQDLARRRGEVAWVSQIEAALEENRLHLFYQKIHSLDDGDGQFCFEVLLRMTDRSGELILPGLFIPAAEHYKLMPAIDRWVIRHTLNWLSDPSTKRDCLGSCSINLSGQSIADPFMKDFILDQLEESNVPAEMICFEITETAAITNLSQATNFMSALHDAGCQFALDDFGSGMSSYGYLKRLPVDYLKIDGEFVRDMANDKISHAMVRSIHEIGHIMGKKTIAEYVENEEILVMLKKLGVNYAQGYAIHRPQALEDM
jgi:diguanylate cyclase (GGDEF)-like protein/PAS domain S-box-containing protein